ncbi:hypothetical protein Indivirus_7_17 [Indivirus ILV1]|uniref:Peptidase M61 catalytic domain-containing protein n=1 Tax=Indivirus ILV1 TaxID=1977633 RepID=A0A1V0SE83_9VIRU|nr:hypothetical protein Indivirus_7_17 [Indivirus ILV1]
MSYHDNYNKYLTKYLQLKNLMRNQNYKLHVEYRFELHGNELTIIIKANQNIDWFLGEQWCTEEINDKVIIKKEMDYIKYNISKKIHEYKDDRLYCYPMVRNNYACFTGVIGLYLPKLSNDYADFKVTYITNFPLFISGIGRISESVTIISNLYLLKTQLYVFTENYIESDYLTLTHKDDAYFFMDKNKIIKKISKFIDKCYEFFEIKNKIKFLINYNGFLVENGSQETGKGGNGNYAGFNYAVTETQKTQELEKELTVYLLHELYHHFNKSSDYASNWFSEGFDEYFCRYLSMSHKKFIQECNIFLKKYWLNPYRNSKITIMTRENFWKNKFIEKLPYEKGFVYALYLHQKYKNDFIDKYKKIILELYYNPKMVINNQILKEMLTDDKFNDYIVNGNTIIIDYDYEIDMKTINFGFDIESAINSHIVRKIKKTSEAYKNGLRNGNISKIHINDNIGTVVIIQNNIRFAFNMFCGNYIKIPQKN